jgi:hypothetical protein
MLDCWEAIDEVAQVLTVGAGPPWQEVVPLRCAGPEVVQAIAEDAYGVAGLVQKSEGTCGNSRNRRHVLRSFPPFFLSRVIRTGAIESGKRRSRNTTAAPDAKMASN